MMAPPLSPALIFGCGYLGRRVARAWRTAGRPVFALTRSHADALTAEGITPITGDVLEPATLDRLPAVRCVLIALAPSRGSTMSFRELTLTGLSNILDALPGGERVVFISSTGVYGQSDGSIVDESSPTVPHEESGRALVEAEQLLLDRHPDAIVLRFAGIYGPGRLFRREELLQGVPLSGDPQKWLNLIHLEDGVEAVLKAELRGHGGEKYVIVDNTPVRRGEFFAELARALGAPPVRFDFHGPGDTGRRVSNQKARRELAFEPQFPSFIEGITASL